MIGNISKGQNFYGLFSYLLKKTQNPRIVFNSTLEKSAANIAAEFKRIADKRPSVQYPVKHISIAFAPEDGEIDNITKHEIGKRIVKEMGYTANQWVAIAHGRSSSDSKRSRNHDHFHLAINAITYNGMRINDGCEYGRLDRILRAIEKEYNFRRVRSIKNKKYRRPSNGQYHKFQQEFDRWLKEVQNNAKLKPPQEPEIQALEAIIEAAVEDKPTMSEYLARLQHLGYRVDFYKTERGRHRMKYQLKSSDRQVSRIKGGSLAKLKKLGVDYKPQRDSQAIALMKQNKKIPITQDKLLTRQQIQKYQFRWLKAEQKVLLEKYQQLVSNQNNCER